jgi:hypothetical protein
MKAKARNRQKHRTQKNFLKFISLDDENILEKQANVLEA